MTEDAYTQLAETLERLAHATGQPDQLADVLDVGDLSRRTAIPEDVVATMLEGGRAKETSVLERVLQRLNLLRESRRREDGNRYSLGELASIAGVSRQTLSEWGKRGVPSLESADKLRRFFGLPAGFLTAEEPEALNDALQSELHKLEAQSDPLASLRTPEFYRLALRASHMSEAKMKILTDWAEMITGRDTGEETDS